jgi:hypothetical protein
MPFIIKPTGSTALPVGFFVPIARQDGSHVYVRDPRVLGLTVRALTDLGEDELEALVAAGKVLRSHPHGDPPVVPLNVAHTTNYGTAASTHQMALLELELVDVTGMEIPAGDFMSWIGPDEDNPGDFGVVSCRVQ